MRQSDYIVRVWTYKDEDEKKILFHEEITYENGQQPTKNEYYVNLPLASSDLNFLNHSSNLTSAAHKIQFLRM